MAFETQEKSAMMGTLMIMMAARQAAFENSVEIQ